jgi:hypothetical protein
VKNADSVGDKGEDDPVKGVCVKEYRNFQGLDISHKLVAHPRSGMHSSLVKEVRNGLEKTADDRKRATVEKRRKRTANKDINLYPLKSLQIGMD